MRRIAILVFVGLLACEPKGSGLEGDDVTTQTTGGSEGDDAATETTSETAELPVECEGVVDAANSPECLEALTEICRAHQSGADCWSAPPMQVHHSENIGPHLYCAWFEVARLANTETCEVGAVYGRCEVARRISGWGWTGDPCHDGTYYEGGAYNTFVEAQELVDWVVVSPPGFDPIEGVLFLDGPLSPDTTGCWTDAAPAWCACGPAACEATGELP